MLEGAYQNAAGAILYVVSDGENNRGDLEASTASAEQKGVTIHTIAISQAADSTMNDIAHQTGGKAFSYLEILNGSVGLAASFLEAAGSSVTAQNSAPATVCTYCCFVILTSTSISYFQWTAEQHLCSKGIHNKLMVVSPKLEI